MTENSSVFCFINPLLCNKILVLFTHEIATKPISHTIIDSILYFLTSDKFSSEFLEKLKFGIGDGNLQYYLYNWKCPKMDPKNIGLVLQ